MATSSAGGEGGGGEGCKCNLRTKRAPTTMSTSSGKMDSTTAEDVQNSVEKRAMLKRKLAESRQMKEEELRAEVAARHQFHAAHSREERRAAARMKLKADMKLLEDNLNAPDPFAGWPEVAIRDYLLKHLDTPSRINICKASPFVKKVLGTKQASWGLGEALCIFKLFEVLMDNDKDEYLRECIGSAIEMNPDLEKALVEYSDVEDDDSDLSEDLDLVSDGSDSDDGNWAELDGDGEDIIGTEAIRKKCYLFTMKKLRLVCRDWRWAVDNFFSRVYSDELLSHPNWNWKDLLTQNSYLNMSLYNPSWGNWKHIVGHYSPYKFSPRSEEQLTSFMDFFGDGEDYENSIVTKSLELHPSGEILGRSLKLLDNCGGQIRCAKLTRFVDNMKEVEVVHRCLRKIPEVASLDLYISAPWNYNGEGDDGVPTRFPPLPRLVNLAVCGATGNFGPPLLQSIAVYFDQLHTLTMTDVAFLNYYDPARHSTFPSLQRLSLSVDSAEGLLKLRQWTSPLKEVDFCSSAMAHVTMGVYLYASERFWPTLVAIKLGGGGSMDRATTFEDLHLEEPTMFTLPNLKILAIALGCKGCFNLDLLLKLSHPSRYLELFHRDCSHHKKWFAMGGPRQLQLYGNYFEKLWESNVWELLPALERIAMSGWWIVRGRGLLGPRYFTRGEYEAGLALAKPVGRKAGGGNEAKLRRLVPRVD